MREAFVLIGALVLSVGLVMGSIAHAADARAAQGTAVVQSGKGKLAQVSKRTSKPKTQTTDTPTRVWTVEMACCEPQ